MPAFNSIPCAAIWTLHAVTRVSSFFFNNIFLADFNFTPATFAFHYSLLLSVDKKLKEQNKSFAVKKILIIRFSAKWMPAN